MGRTSRSAPAPTDPAQARDDRRRRARSEALEVLERFDRPYRSFEVRNPVHGTRYRVLAPGRPPVLLCPCPDFGHREVDACKHVEAVQLHLGSHPSAPGEAPQPAPVDWGPIEAAIRAYPSLPWTDLRPLWAVGRRLIDVTGG